MNTLKTILVGVDFSECSRCALEQAARLARWNNASLSVIHVMDSSARDNSLPGFQPELDEKSCGALLQGNLRQFTSVPEETPAIYSVTQAKTHGHGIAEYCRSVDADLVVLGTRGKTALQYILLGSTVERLLREIPCSVLAVRPPVAEAGNTPAENAGR